MHITEWYFPQDNKTKDKLHYEILKQVNRKSIAFFGDKVKSRFNNIGKKSNLTKRLGGRFREDKPYWDMYATVEYVASTTKTTRKEFKQDLEQGSSLEELKEKYKTTQNHIEARKEELEKNKLPEEFAFTANFKDFFNHYTYDTCPFDLVFDIDGDDVIIQQEQITQQNIPDKYDSPKQYVKKEYTRKQIINAAHQTTRKITQYLDKHNAPYSVKFSGGRGFHITIPREKLEDYITTSNYSKTSRQFTEFIISQTELTKQHIDMSVCDSKTIFRVPYTMHTGSNLIAIPLTREQFRNFELKYTSPDYIRENIDLRDRGLCLRTGKANKLISKFNEWTEQKDETISTDKTQIRRNKEVKSVLQEIQRLDEEQKQKLKKQVNW
jgi:hypothetical protein